MRTELWPEIFRPPLIVGGWFRPLGLAGRWPCTERNQGRWRPHHVRPRTDRAASPASAFVCDACKTEDERPLFSLGVAVRRCSARPEMRRPRANSLRTSFSLAASQDERAGAGLALRSVARSGRGRLTGASAHLDFPLVQVPAPARREVPGNQPATISSGRKFRPEFRAPCSGPFAACLPGGRQATTFGSKRPQNGALPDRCWPSSRSGSPCSGRPLKKLGLGRPPSRRHRGQRQKAARPVYFPFATVWCLSWLLNALVLVPRAVSARDFQAAPRISPASWRWDRPRKVVAYFVELGCAACGSTMPRMLARGCGCRGSA